MDTTVDGYLGLLDRLSGVYNLPDNMLRSLLRYMSPISQVEQQNRYSEPMPWIGIYIASASLVCILAMAIDLLHGLRKRKLWFPCYYSTLNAASLSLVAVAIKLPMDINNLMPGGMDRAAKLGSMTFMLTVMANQMPSLVTMDNKEILANIIALFVLVITLIVNVCIQIITGVISSYPKTLRGVSDHRLSKFILELDIFPESVPLSSPYAYLQQSRIIAIIYVAMLLVLSIIQICSALMILTSKRILELKYQKYHERILDLELKRPATAISTEKLKQCVGYHWVMAESPQFATACLATTSASGVICALSTILHILLMLFTINQEHDSDYGWSIPVIFLTQFIGVLLGTIAPLCRCFASFKMSKKLICEHMKVFKVEHYWTRTLLHWKASSIPLPFRSRKCEVSLESFKVLILSFSIVFQKTVVVTCKIISLIPLLLMLVVLWFRKWLKVKNPEQQTQDTDFNKYILHFQDYMDKDLTEGTLKVILKNRDRLIQKAEKQQPKNLMNLLQKSCGFEGIQYFDSHHVPPLLSTEYPDCWSLPLINLTTIAISLPNIQNDIVDSLLRSVSEGLLYVSHVEESLNATPEYESIQHAAKMLWLEVEVHHKWLGYKLKDHVPQVNTARNILEWFRDRAKNMVTELEGMYIEALDQRSVRKSVCANSMYHITQTILISYPDTNDEVSQEELFARLSSMISGILAACLTNLPQVIIMKCHTTSIKKTEASVYAAAKLLGETTQIINNLKDLELPSLNPDEFPFFNKWCAYFRDPSP